MAIKRVWLGRPEGRFGMQELTAIRVGQPLGGTGMTATFSRAAVSQRLASGGYSASRKSSLKTGYSIEWNLLDQTKLDFLRSFFDGRQSGPYCLVDPSEYNYLPPNVASFGLVTGALASVNGRVEWTAGTGAIAPSTQAGPTGLITGVAGWTGASNSSVLWMGLNNVIDASWLPPILQGKSHRFAVYAKLLSGTGTLTAAVPYGVGASAPAGNATVTASGVALNTSTWQEVSATVASSFNWGANDYCTMKLTVSSASSPSILLAAASMVYDDTAATSLIPWVAGIGVPRVVIPADSPSPVGRPGLRDFTMTLAET